MALVFKQALYRVFKVEGMTHIKEKRKGASFDSYEIISSRDTLALEIITSGSFLFSSKNRLAFFHKGPATLGVVFAVKAVMRQFVDFFQIALFGIF